MILFFQFDVQVFSANETAIAVANNNKKQTNFALQMLHNASIFNLKYFIIGQTFGMTYFLT